MNQPGTAPLYRLDALQAHLEQGRTLLTPNFRLARRIRSQWDQQQAASGQGCWPTLRVYALEHWLGEQWQQARRAGRVSPRQRIDTAWEKELWRQVIEADQSQSGEYTMLAPGAAASMAAQARQLLVRWQVPIADAGVAAGFRLDPDCAVFQRWLHQFEQRLDAGGWATTDDCHAQLLAAPEQTTDDLVLVEFDEIPPLQRAVLEHLSGELHWSRNTEARSAQQCQGFSDKQQELQAVADRAVALSRDPAQPTLGIVLVDMPGDRAPLEYALRAAFDCLGEDYAGLPVNFSTGFTLDRVPVVRDALRCLDLVTDKLRLEDIAALQQSRFVILPEEAQIHAVAALATLYRNAVEKVDASDWRAALDQAAKGQSSLAELLLAQSTRRLRRLVQTPSQWLAAVCEVLDDWSWPGKGPLDSLEYQQVELFYQVLEDLAGRDALLGELGFQAVVQALRTACETQAFQPQTPDSTIQVLGPLEAAGLQFDELWLVGAQATRWPAPPQPNPFIPHALQAKLAMPHATHQREWQFTAGLMQQYAANCSHLRASYVLQVDGVSDAPSAVLADWPIEHPPEVSPVPELWTTMNSDKQLQTLHDEQAPPVDDRERDALRGGSGILEDQSNCPFRAFARRRLGLEAFGDYRSGLTAAERGDLLHRALRRLFESIADSEQLAALSPQGERHVIEHAASGAMDDAAGKLRHRVSAACLALEQSRLVALLGQWLEQEREREPFTVLAQESSHAITLAGLPLSLRVDRVDSTGDGQRLVIDYKSGAGKVGDWLGQRPQKPQLPLYGVTAEPPVAGISYALVRDRNCAYVGVGEITGVPGVQSDLEKAVRGESLPHWHEWIARWREDLELLARNFLAGDAAVDPLASACRYCGMQALCRVDVPAQQEAQP